MIDFTKVRSLVDSSKNILLTTHENPDGDGLGSCAAMYHYLKEIGKECRIITYSDFPVEYGFLNAEDIFEIHDLKEHRNWIKNIDLAIVFDVGNIKRLKSIYLEKRKDYQMILLRQ